MDSEYLEGFMDNKHLKGFVADSKREITNH